MPLSVPGAPSIGLQTGLSLPAVVAIAITMATTSITMDNSAITFAMTSTPGAPPAALPAPPSSIPPGYQAVVDIDGNSITDIDGDAVYVEA